MKPLHQLLKVDYTDKEAIWLADQKALRKLIGILGMALPALLLLFAYLDSGHSTPLESISHYYYTRVGSILVMVVSLLAIFLIIYKGKAPLDFTCPPSQASERSRCCSFLPAILKTVAR